MISPPLHTRTFPHCRQLQPDCVVPAPLHTHARARTAGNYSLTVSYQHPSDNSSEALRIMSRVGYAGTLTVAFNASFEVGGFRVCGGVKHRAPLSDVWGRSPWPTVPCLR